MDVPFGSIMAAILVCIGVGIFCGTSQVAFIETMQMFEVTSEEFNDRAKDFFSPMQISVYSVTGFMVFVAILFVFVSFMATAQSKRQIYEDDTVPCGGRCCTSLALIIGYLLTILWLIINGGLVLLTIFTLMVSRYQDFLAQNDTSNSQIDLAYYGFTNTGDLGTKVIGTDDLKTFGDSAQQAFIFYAIAYGGSVVVLVGMIHFLMCFSANWGHLKDGIKRRDYERKRQQEEQELEEINAGYVRENPRIMSRNNGPAVIVPESYEMHVNSMHRDRGTSSMNRGAGSMDRGTSSMNRGVGSMTRGGDSRGSNGDQRLPVNGYY